MLFSAIILKSLSADNQKPDTQDVELSLCQVGMNRYRARIASRGQTSGAQTETDRPPITQHALVQGSSRTLITEMTAADMTRVMSLGAITSDACGEDGTRPAQSLRLQSA